MVPSMGQGCCKTKVHVFKDEYKVNKKSGVGEHPCQALRELCRQVVDQKTAIRLADDVHKPKPCWGSEGPDPCDEALREIYIWLRHRYEGTHHTRSCVTPNTTAKVTEGPNIYAERPVFKVQTADLPYGNHTPRTQRSVTRRSQWTSWHQVANRGRDFCSLNRISGDRANVFESMYQTSYQYEELEFHGNSNVGDSFTDRDRIEKLPESNVNRRTSGLTHRGPAVPLPGCVELEENGVETGRNSVESDIYSISTQSDPDDVVLDLSMENKYSGFGLRPSLCETESRPADGEVSARSDRARLQLRPRAAKGIRSPHFSLYYNARVE